MRLSRERMFQAQGNRQCKGPEVGSRSRVSQWLEWSEGGKEKWVVGGEGGQRGQRQVTHPLVGHGEDLGCFSK